MQTLDLAKLKSHRFLKKRIVIPTICFLLVICGLCAYIFPSATIAITVKSRSISNSEEVLANVNTSAVDINTKLIPAYYASVNESSSSSLTTTGSKSMPAHGQVTIYNFNTTTVNIPQGTEFDERPDGFTYTLDTAVSIPGTTGSQQTQTGALTSKSGGAQYDIKGGTAFTIIGLDPTVASQVHAVAASDFAGGDQVFQTVAQSDQDNLLKSLEQQLYQKGSADLQAQIDSNSVSVKDTKQNTDVSKSFDSNVGDKASLLNLSLTTKTSVLTYKPKDIDSFASQLLSQSLQTKETLANEHTDIHYESYDSTSGNIKLKLMMNATATPILDKTAIAAYAKSKTSASTKMYVTGLDGVVDCSVHVSPFWYGVLTLMPFRTSQIHVTIKTQ